MSVLRKLASQTAIYGLSSIVGRFLNYLLVPLHTSEGIFKTGEYGVISEMYAYVSFLIIVLTYGMETAFFRFYSKEEFSKNSVYATAFWSLFSSSSVFILMAYVFSEPIAEWMHYPNHSEWVLWFALIIGLDALSSIPFAYLRAEGKAVRFAMVNMVNVMVNIGLNLFFLAYCMRGYNAGEHNWLIDTFYNPSIGVGYVFIANLIASVVKFLMLSPEMIKAFSRVRFSLLEKMLVFGLPLLIAGFAGMINETLDRILLKRMLTEHYSENYALEQVGIYSGVYKLSIIITLFIQAFRYAAEPFFFAQEKQKDAKETYAKVMHYFVIVCAVIFLGVMLYIDILKYFLGSDAYWNGLSIVPVLLFANIFLGIYYNQSIWYKLSGKTIYGAYIAIFGAVLTVLLNFIWIPVLGFVGSAWATFICYGSMMLISYLLGQKFYPVPYRIGWTSFYLLAAFGAYFGASQIEMEWGVQKFLLHSLIFVLFLGMVYLIEKKGLQSKPNTNESQDHQPL
jgi:O-antigen/teichoic acid export membrane protein